MSETPEAEEFSGPEIDPTKIDHLAISVDGLTLAKSETVVAMLNQPITVRLFDEVTLNVRAIPDTEGTSHIKSDPETLSIAIEFAYREPKPGIPVMFFGTTPVLPVCDEPRVWVQVAISAPSIIATYVISVWSQDIAAASA